MFISDNFQMSFLYGFLLVFSSSLVAQTPFWTETFSDSTAALSNWTSGGINPGPEDWKWSDDTFIGGIPPFLSPSSEDGFMRFDSDSNGSFEHDITLTSPIINCSGKSQVYLELFSQYVFYIYEFSQVQIGVSINGGNFVYRNILEEVEPGYLFETVQRTTLELPEAANQPNVRIQIKWLGFFEYFLHIDDLALYDTPPILANDLSIQDIRQPAAYETPLSQVDSMFFFGMARNEGASPLTNVYLRVSVIDPNSDVVFQDTSARITQLAAGADDVSLFIEKGFLPTVPGQYMVYLTVEADEEDGFFSNNRQVFTFTISEDFFSVNDDDLQDVAIPVLNGDFWEGGSRYFLKNGQGYEADKARFMVFSEDENGNETHFGQTISIILYKSKIDLDTAINLTDDDLEVAGFTNYTFTSDDKNFTFINAPLFQEDGETVGIPLEDETDYLLMLSLPDGIAIPYTYRKVIYDISTVVRNGSDWFPAGFESLNGETGRLALVVNMGIREMAPIATREASLAAHKIRSFPNPANDLYQIDLVLENSSRVHLQLTSIAGQLIREEEYLAFQSRRIQLDVSDLAAGVYLVKIRTEEGNKTLRFLKQ